MHPLSSEVVKACLPAGQVRAFRHNMMALMTVTGAKGSVVNFSQVCGEGMPPKFGCFCSVPICGQLLAGVCWQRRAQHSVAWPGTA
jgi:hypothetical protein